jgi:hypothetical protein
MSEDVDDQLFGLHHFEIFAHLIIIHPWCLTPASLLDYQVLERTESLLR